MNNYYDILGISKQASQDDIKKMYRQLSKKYHPDINDGNDEMFKKINEAYSVLGDENKRREYDTPKINFSDFFGQHFGEDIFRSQRRNANLRGSDIKIDLSITVKDCVLGLDKEIRYYRKDLQGREELRTIKINIPSNCDDGNMFRVRGGGNEGQRFTGDLIVIISIESDGVYEKYGNDIIYTHSINPIDVLLGTEVIVDLFTTKIKVNSPTCLQPDQPIRVRGKGFMTSYGQGDLYIKFKVISPKQLTDTEIRLLEELKKGDNFNH
jgi:curved DNA-binding protein